MFVVIFRAHIADIDNEYIEMAAQLRELALNQYGCVEFVVVTEGEQEIALSYWHDDVQIKQWKQNVDHLIAQKFGRAKWYKNYRAQVAEIRRDYSGAV
jgi:heme-degrading monooxygenase HmoA